MTDFEIKELIEISKLPDKKEFIERSIKLNKEDSDRFQVLSSIDIFENELQQFIKNGNEERWKDVVSSINLHHKMLKKEITEYCFTYFQSRAVELKLELNLPLEHYQEFQDLFYYDRFYFEHSNPNELKNQKL